MAGQLNPATEARYLELLGLAPGATREALDAAYYLALGNLPQHPTEEDLARQQRLHHAYAVLRRIYKAREGQRSFGVRRARWAAVALFAAAGALGSGLLWSWPDLRLRLVHYEPGTVLGWKHARAPYAVVVGYERARRFATGRAAPAYELRLVENGQTVWLSERVVEKGMARIEPAQSGTLP